MEYQNIIYKVEDGIATIQLNRPKALNALNSEINKDIMAALQEVQADSSVRVLIMTGSERAFAAGADVKEMAEANPRYAREFCGLAIEINNLLESLPIPTIAAVGGFAFGGGCEMTLACDFRVVAPSSKMTMAFVNLGLSGDTGSIYNLIRLVGPDKAKLLMMTGEACRGEECVKMGLATVLAEEGKLAETTYALAAKLASKSGDAHSAQKRVINRFFYDRMADYFATEALEIAWCGRQPDFTEAVNAFLERRTPEYNKKP